MDKPYCDICGKQSETTFQVGDNLYCLYCYLDLEGYDPTEGNMLKFAVTALYSQKQITAWFANMAKAWKTRCKYYKKSRTYWLGIVRTAMNKGGESKTAILNALKESHQNKDSHD